MEFARMINETAFERLKLPFTLCKSVLKGKNSDFGK